MGSINYESRPYQQEDRDGLLPLWGDVFPASSPHNEPETSLNKKLLSDPDLFLVAVMNDMVVGSVMGSYDSHRGWIYSLAVTPSLRRKGIASALMHEIESLLRERGYLKGNLQVLSSNKGVVALYEELGFHVEERISMGKKLYS